MGWYYPGKESIGNPCEICRQPIKKTDKVYFENGKITHALCEWEKEVNKNA